MVREIQKTGAKREFGARAWSQQASKTKSESVQPLTAFNAGVEAWVT